MWKEVVLGAAALFALPQIAIAADPIKIGVPMILSGPGALFGEPTLKGIQMLVDEVNAYVDEFLADARLYLRSPNRAAHFPWILKAYVATAAGELTAALFAAPEDVHGPVAAA